MSLSIYNYKTKENKLSAEISTSNILNYKRRSKLVTYNKNTLNTLSTLKNCYIALFDLKMILSDYINLVKKESRFFTKSECDYIENVFLKTKTEILSAYNIFIKNIESKNIKKNKFNKEEKKIINNIDEISQVLCILYNDTKKYK
jgi:hypothetical protein